MALRKPSFDGDLENREINISPMIDVMFILLIFFVVTMAFSEKSALKIERPKSVQDEKLNEKALKIFVDKDGKIFAAGSYATLDTLKVLARNSPEKSALIEADASLEISSLVEVMDACSEGGIGRIFISSQPKNRGAK